MHPGEVAHLRSLGRPTFDGRPLPTHRRGCLQAHAHGDPQSAVTQCDRLLQASQLALPDRLDAALRFGLETFRGDDARAAERHLEAALGLARAHRFL